MESHCSSELSWFWHNHFVTKLDDYGCPSWMYQYQHLLQKHALGNFKDLIKDITLDPIMINMLNINTNFADSINENYARELQELFRSESVV